MRIVSLLPSATEICYALGLGDQLVGVTHECDFPPAATAKPRLTRSTLPPSTGEGGDASAAIDRHVRASVHAGSGLYALDQQLLEQLAPDLILTQELCEVCAVSYEVVSEAARRLRSDPRIVSLEPSSVDEVFATMETVGGLAGEPERASALIGRLRERLTHLGAGPTSHARPTVVVLEWTDPPFGAGHWTPELVARAGGIPLVGSGGGPSVTTTWEAVAKADPDVLIIAPCGFELAAARRAAQALLANVRWASLRAVREGRAFAMDGSAYVNRPGPRLVETAEIFAHAITGRPLPELPQPALTRVASPAG